MKIVNSFSPLLDMTDNRKIHTLVLSLFFLSGLSGLIYQIVWMRMLRLVMGNTVFSAATVLTAFMGGLALGSYVAGRIVDRRSDALRIYGILEGVVGVYCLLLPWIVGGAGPVYRWLYLHYHEAFFLFALLRFSVCFGMLIVPATLMGATLPVLTRYFADNFDRLGWTVGRLYAINTFGAVAGSFIAGFVLIPNVGVRWSLYIGVFVNLLVLVAALVLHAKSPEVTAGTEREEDRTPGPRPGVRAAVLLTGFGMAGFASMVYEVAWMRALSLVVGSSVYAFSLMLTAFIAGIGLGSALFARFVDRRRDLALLLAGVESIIGLSALMMVPIFGRLPTVIVGIVVRFSRSFGLLYGIEFAVMFLLMMVPTTLMGAAFPIVSKMYTRSLRVVGRSIGVVYSANTLGSLLGSFSAGFLLIPWLGIQRTILAAVWINLAVAAAFFLLSHRASRHRRSAFLVAAVPVVMIASSYIPQWDRMLLSSGAYLYAYKYSTKSSNEQAELGEVMTRRRRLLYHKEGITTTVTVTESGGELFLKVNGKTDASSKGDLRTQSLLGHLPLLIHPDAQDVLVIGLGSGITLGSVERHPVRQIDCVEISPEVVDASEYFRTFNYDAVDDPRARVIVADGRNHLALTDRRYDTIISQPSNLWISGMADLFTQEFFESCADRLREGGVMCQWVQAYMMSTLDFQVVIRTLQSVFPYVTLWEPDAGGDYFLIGRQTPIEIDCRRMAARIEDDRVLRDLARVSAQDLSSLLACFVTDDEGLRGFAGHAAIHTDDNALLEFSAPKGLYRNLAARTDAFDIQHLTPHRMSVLPLLTGADTTGIATAYEARRHAVLGRAYHEEGQLDEAISEYTRALAINPYDIDAVDFLPEAHFARGYRYIGNGQYDLATEEYRRGIALRPGDPNAHANLGMLYEHKGMYDDAVGAYRRAVELYPRFGEAYYSLGGLYARRHRYEDAATAYRDALEIEPDMIVARLALGNVYARQGMYEAAEEAYRAVLRGDPEHVSARNNLAGVYASLGRYDEAVREAKRALRAAPDDERIRKMVERLERARRESRRQ